MPVGAITTGIAAYGAYKAHKAASNANKTSTAQLGKAEAQGDTLNETARMQQAAAQPFLAQGQASSAQGQRTSAGGSINPDFEQSAGYYRNILSGDRAAATGALAPDLAAITDNYRGAERNAQSTLRGGQRNLALSELNRDRVGQVAGLRQQLRPGAAAALSDIGRFRFGAGQEQARTGQGAAGIGANLLSGSASTQGTVYSGLNSQFGTLNANTQNANAYANQAGSAFGNTLIDLVKSSPWGGGGKAPIATNPSYTPPFSPYPSAPTRTTY